MRSLKNLAIGFAAITILGTITPTTVALASENQDNGEVQDNTELSVQKYDGRTITETTDGLTLEDESTGENLKLTYLNDEKTEATIDYGNGKVEKLETLSNGDITADGEVIIALEETENSNVLLENSSNRISARATSWKWNYVNSVKYSALLKGTINSMALSLFGLVPGLGTIASVVSILSAFHTLVTWNKNKVYIKQSQYIRSDHRKLHNINRLYKNSNYRTRYSGKTESIVNTFG